MPQIWMTYEELASLLNCRLDEVREEALKLQLDRKRSRDGHTRVKLGPLWMALFIEAVRKSDPLDQAIIELRQTHELMNTSHAKATRAAPSYRFQYR